MLFSEKCFHVFLPYGSLFSDPAHDFSSTDRSLSLLIAKALPNQDIVQQKLERKNRVSHFSIQVRDTLSHGLSGKKVRKSIVYLPSF